MAEAVQPVMRRVWFAPTARRHYQSKWAACVGEARARIKAKRPSEGCEHDERGNVTYRGWTWRDIPRAEVLLKRYARLLFRSL